MKTITVEYDEVTPATVENRLSRDEAVLSIGNRRYPATLTDRQALMQALSVADAIARSNIAWRGDIVAALQKLDAEDRARETATT
ncbi:hypothetical protein ACOZ38_25485 [Sphaerisporangium viridialbum]|uniref:hypothetical protein n=1 Tax=Sphaerisporangium viridialbum TaxID=46189 RepID=UPI003C73A058